MSHLPETSLKQQQDANCKSIQRHTARALSEINGQKTGPLAPSSYYVQNDTGKYSATTYVLQDMNRILEDTFASHVDSRRNEDTTKRSSSPKCDRSPASTQRQRPHHTSRKPSQQQSVSRFNKTNAASSNPSAVRNKSTECSVIPANVAKAGYHQSTRPTVRPTQTTSATVTRCAKPSPRPPHTSHQLQRKTCNGKMSETEPPTKRIQTYSVKKPLPYKAGCAALRRQMSAAKNLPANSCASPSSESMLTQISDPHWLHDDVDDDHDATQLVTPDKLIPGTVSKTSSIPKLVALPRTRTPKPSIKQLKDVGRGQNFRQQAKADFTLQHSQQSYVNGQRSKARSCNKGRRDDMQTAEQVSGTVRCHSSPSEHSVTSRYDNHYYTPEQQQQVCNDPVDCSTHHVQVADNVTGRQQQQQIEQYQQTSDLMSSASRSSIATCRPHHRTTLTFRQIPPTLSMSTLATDVGRFATRPVPVAPSGPAGHRRASKIPRPKSGMLPMPSTSVMSTISRCSSITSLRSEFNYARPMPIERIPFCKFGLECIVPLARQEVSITPVEAFSITGVSGQRKRFLPLIESTAKDLWERAGNAVAPLSVVKARYDAGEHSCNVSIISSVVARPVAHTATQTLKSVSLSTDARQRKKTRSPRKENPVKQDDSNEDYSDMLVRLVQLLYLQTKLNASKGDQNNSAADEAAKVATQPPASQRTLLYQLQNQQQRHTQQQRYTAPRETVQKNTHPYSSDQSARVYRMGSSVTQVYSKNYPAGHADVKSANSWANAVKSRTVYFDNAQSETKPWSSNRTQATASFKPNYSQHHHYDNRYSRISSYPGTRYGYGYRPTTDY